MIRTMSKNLLDFLYPTEPVITKTAESEIVIETPILPESSIQHVSEIDLTRASELKSLAENMHSQIDYQLNPPIKSKRSTTLRNHTLIKMKQEGELLQQIQTILFILAIKWETGNVPRYFEAVNCRSHVRLILTQKEYPILNIDKDSLLGFRNYVNSSYRRSIDQLISNGKTIDGIFTIDSFFYPEINDLIIQASKGSRKKGCPIDLKTAIKTIRANVNAFKKISNLGFNYQEDLESAQKIFHEYLN